MDERARRVMARSAAVVELVEKAQRRARELRARTAELRDLAEKTLDDAQTPRAPHARADAFDAPTRASQAH
jgi:hypothetical protein